MKTHLVQFNATPNDSVILGLTDTVTQSFLNVTRRDCNQFIGEGQCKFFQEDVRIANEWVLAVVMSPPVNSVNNNRGSGQFGRPPA